MFSQRLIDLRKSRNLTQSEMAKILDVARTTYSSYEQGRRMPDADIQNRIADYFDVTLDYLHGRKKTPQWATKEDLIQLDHELKTSAPMSYNGVELNDEDKVIIDELIEEYFWKRMKEMRENN